MVVAGIEIETYGIELLIALLRDEYYLAAANTLHEALCDGVADVGLTLKERTAVLDVLDDPPSRVLSNLRGILLEEYVDRVRVGRA